MKVSVCIPAYKEPEITAKCLESIAGQTYIDYEVVITDDSPDDSFGVMVENFKDRIKNLRYYKNTGRKGSPGNWNECMEKAQGEYIKILHRDDSFSSPYSLSLFAAAAEQNPDARFFFSSTLMSDYIKNLEHPHVPKRDMIEKIKKDPLLLLTGNVIGAPSVTFFKKTHELFDENLKWLVDIDFYIRLMRSGKCIFLDAPLVKVTKGAPWQVTESCQNKEVEFGEWFYVHRKYKPGTKLTIGEFFHLLRLAYKYRIVSWKKLK